MNITKQYIAGFIDGEGYLGIIKKTSKVCTLGYYYTPVIKIAQISRNDEVLIAIQKFIGHGNLEPRKSNLKNAADSTSLEFRGMKRVTPIAKKLLPYLIVKKKQAQILLKFSRLSSDEERTELYNRIRLLNKRGLATTE